MGYSLPTPEVDRGLLGRPVLSQPRGESPPITNANMKSHEVLISEKLPKKNNRPMSSLTAPYWLKGLRACLHSLQASSQLCHSVADKLRKQGWESDIPVIRHPFSILALAAKVV